jgi:hypothetical protein
MAMQSEHETDPGDEGVDAYCLGMTRSACPYPAWKPQRYAWLLRWDEAKEIDEEEEG